MSVVSLEQPDFDGGLDDPRNCERFMAVRRAAIANKLSEFLGIGDQL